MLHTYQHKHRLWAPHRDTTSTRPGYETFCLTVCMYLTCRYSDNAKLCLCYCYFVSVSMYRLFAAIVYSFWVCYILPWKPHNILHKTTRKWRWCYFMFNWNNHTKSGLALWTWPVFQQIKYVLNGFTNGTPWQSNKFKAQSFALPICNAAKTAKVFVFGMVNLYSSVLSGCCVCQYHQFSMNVSHH